MAGVSAKEIKNRIRSMESTRQITKAMEMVASSKLRKAQDRVQSSRPYFEILYDTINTIVSSTGDLSSPYLTQRSGNKVLYVVMAGDRGLAGGYNSNVLKLAMSASEGKEVTVLPVGKKAVEYFNAHGIPLLTGNYTEAASVSLGDCFTVAKQLCKLYRQGEYDGISVCYTNFTSVLAQTPTVLPLLPLTRQQTGTGTTVSNIVYEPDSAQVFETIIPEYLGGVLYGALCESRASEQAARRNAMDAATQNADEMIGQLSLQFNRARQAAITQEITEIVAGSQSVTM